LVVTKIGVSDHGKEVLDIGNRGKPAVRSGLRVVDQTHVPGDHVVLRHVPDDDARLVVLGLGCFGPEDAEPGLLLVGCLVNRYLPASGRALPKDPASIARGKLTLVAAKSG
jgi:hypothetical protein